MRLGHEGHGLVVFAHSPLLDDNYTSPLTTTRLPHRDPLRAGVYPPETPPTWRYSVALHGRSSEEDDGGDDQEWPKGLRSHEGRQEGGRHRFDRREAVALAERPASSRSSAPISLSRGPDRSQWGRMVARPSQRTHWPFSGPPKAPISDLAPFGSQGGHRGCQSNTPSRRRNRDHPRRCTAIRARARSRSSAGYERGGQRRYFLLLPSLPSRCSIGEGERQKLYTPVGPDPERCPRECSLSSVPSS